MKLAVILYLAIGGAASLRLSGNIRFSANFGFSVHRETNESSHFEFDDSCRTSDGKLGECTTAMQCKRVWPIARRNFNTIYRDGCRLSHHYCCPIPTDDGDNEENGGQVDSNCTALVKFENEPSRDWLRIPGKCKTGRECDLTWFGIPADMEVKAEGCSSAKRFCCPIPPTEALDQRPGKKKYDDNDEGQVDSNCTALVKFKEEPSRDWLRIPGKCKTGHECDLIWFGIPADMEVKYGGCNSVKRFCCPIPPTEALVQRPGIKKSDKNNEGQVDSSCTALVKTSQDPSRDYLQKPGKCKTKHDCEQIWSGRTSGPVKIGGCNSLKLLCCPLPPNDAPELKPEMGVQTDRHIDESCRSSDGKLGECQTLKQCGQTWDGAKKPPTADRALSRHGCYSSDHYCCPIPPDHENDGDAKVSVHGNDSSCNAEFKIKSPGPPSQWFQKPGKCKTEDECRQIWTREKWYIVIRPGGCDSSEHHCCPMPPADSPDRRPLLKNDDGGSGSSNGEMPKQIPTNSGVNVTKPVLPRNCGRLRNEKRIFGGHQTDVGEYPWMALLEYEDLDSSPLEQGGCFDGQFCCDISIGEGQGLHKFRPNFDFDFSDRSIFNSDHKPTGSTRASNFGARLCSADSEENGLCVPESICRQKWFADEEMPRFERKDCEMGKVCCTSLKPWIKILDRLPPIFRHFDLGLWSNSEDNSEKPPDVDKNGPKDLLSDCGKQKPVKRITQGGETVVNEFPWMALLEYVNNRTEWESFCGGSLITDRYVLTAAHCIQDRFLQLHGWRLASVRLGEWDIRSDPDCWDQDGTLGKSEVRFCAPKHRRIPIKYASMHDRYDPNSDSLHHDIGLIRLGKLVEFSDYIRPICLPTRDDVPAHLTVAGWGRTEISTNASRLLKVEVPRADEKVCESLFNFITTQLCFGGEKGKDAHEGDSGNPLMDLGNGSHARVIGIVSYGRKNTCRLTDEPAVYTKVYNYMTWINEKILTVE